MEAKKKKKNRQKSEKKNYNGRQIRSEEKTEGDEKR